MITLVVVTSNYFLGKINSSSEQSYFLYTATLEFILQTSWIWANIWFNIEPEWFKIRNIPVCRTISSLRLHLLLPQQILALKHLFFKKIKIQKNPHSSQTLFYKQSHIYPPSLYLPLYSPWTECLNYTLGLGMLRLGILAVWEVYHFKQWYMAEQWCYIVDWTSVFWQLLNDC